MDPREANMTCVSLQPRQIHQRLRAGRRPRSPARRHYAHPGEFPPNLRQGRGRLAADERGYQFHRALIRRTDLPAQPVG